MGGRHITYVDYMRILSHTEGTVLFV
jgi:hypothetical protein